MFDRNKTGEKEFFFERKRKSHNNNDNGDGDGDRIEERIK